MNRQLLTLTTLLLLCNWSLAQMPALNIHAADTIKKGIELYDEGEYDRAISLFNLVHPGDTNYTWALYEKSMALTSAERYDDAIIAATKGIQLTDSSSSVYFNIIGTAFDNSERPEKALKVYNAGISRFPVNAELYFNRAAVFNNLGENEKMLADLKKAVELNPFNASSHLALANLALNEEQYTQALLSLGYFLMIEPRSERSNPNLVYYNNALMGDAELESKDLNLSKPADDFKKTNLLLANKVALREDYEVDSELDIPIVKQLHLAISQAIKKKNPKGFWENYYTPFYRAMFDEDYFEAFGYYVLLSSGNESHQKVIRQNAGDIEAFIAWAAAKLKDVHGNHVEGYIAGQDNIRYRFFDDSHDIEAIGRVNKNDQPIGSYTYYYSNGNPSSAGEYNKKSQKVGTWRYYHSNGALSAKRFFEDGKEQGLSEEFFDNGYRKLTLPYEDDMVKGVVKVYERSGHLNRVMYYKNEAIEDSLVYYYNHGSKERYLPMSNGVIDGQAHYYHPNGVSSYEVGYTEDQRNGEFTSYFSNRSLSEEGNYKDDQYHGDYTSYYPSGQIKAQGAYSEGSKIGDWKYFYYNGNLESKASYDEKGKENGVQERYTPSGKLTHRFVYSKGEIKEYYHFNRDGEVIHEDKRRFGKFWYEGYSVDGVKTIEGNYVGDHKEGLWKYYTSNGDLYEEENYNDEGLLEGDYKTYHTHGSLSRKTTFIDGQLNGYDVSYHSNGGIENHGYFIDGNRNGIWKTYFKDGTPNYCNFYVEDKLSGPQYYYDVDGKLYMIKEFDEGRLTQIHTCAEDSTIIHTHKVEQKAGSETYFYANGQKRFKLPLVGGKFNGEAIWYHGTGAVETKGQYANDERHGKWEWYFPDGTLKLSGEYIYGNQTGEWVRHYENGAKRRVYHFENGKLHGSDKSYWENGNLNYECTYDQGDRNGKYLFYNSKGHINHIRFYEYGRIIGYARMDSNGNKTKMIPLHNETGKVKSYYPNGQLARQYEIVNGRFTGPYINYHENGQKSYEAKYTNDLRNGTVNTYYENGKLRTTIEYHMDDYHGSYTRYWPSGQIKLKGQYLNDERHGFFEYYDKTGQLTKKHEYRNGNLIKEL